MVTKLSMEPIFTVTKDSDFPIYLTLKEGAVVEGHVREGASIGDITRDGYRSMLLYFKRIREGEVLYDSPVPGSSTLKLKKSKIEGPFKTPSIYQYVERAHDVVEEEVARRFISLPLLPIPIYKFFITKYGLPRGDFKSIKEDGEKFLNGVGENVKKKVREMASELSEHKRGLSALVDGSLLIYNFYRPVHPGHAILVSVLGKNQEKIDEILNNTGVYELRESHRYGIHPNNLEDNTRQGLSTIEIPLWLSMSIEGIVKCDGNHIIL